MRGGWAAQFAHIWATSDAAASARDPAFCAALESQLTDQVRETALLIYRYLVVTGDWGEIGEYQIRSAFFENQTESSIARDMACASFKDWDSDRLSADLADRTLTVWDTVITVHEAEKLNRVLRGIGSLYRLQAGYHGKVLEMIWGNVSEEKIGPYWAMTFLSETVRTPHVVGSMAAVIGNGEIFIRDVALRYIFDIKWRPYFEHHPTFVSADPMHQASHRIKLAVAGAYLDAFGSPTASRYFLADLAQTVLFHEVGHGIAQDHFLDPELSGFAEATRVFGENIYTVLHEFLADFVPNVRAQGLYSALTNILSIAAQNPDRAYRMYAMYVSDTWFFDTPDTYMYLYSDLTSYLMSVYVQGRGKIDWDRLATDIGSDVSRPGPLLALVKAGFHDTLAHLRQLASQLEVAHEGRRVPLCDIRDQLLAECQPGVHQGGIWAQYWSKVLGERLHPDDTERLKTQLNQDCLHLMDAILSYFEPDLRYDASTLRFRVADRLLQVF